MFRNNNNNSLVPFSDNFMDSFFKDGFFDAFDRFDKLAKLNNLRMPQIVSDIKETDNSYIVEAEMPGFAKEDIDVSIDGGVLTIKAETKKETEENKDKFVRRERSYGSFVRSYSFDNINEDKISAKYDNGVLVVELPKSEKIETKKGINIE